VKHIVVPAWVVMLATVSFVGGTGLWVAVFQIRVCA
jgi:hypothetical protein